MTTRLAVAAAFAGLALSAPAAAQVLAFGPSDAQERSFNVVAIDPLSLGTPVIDAPYSAEAVTEVSQVLADGNRIERRTSAMIARASDGRTRREQQGVAMPGLLPNSDTPFVTISDPRSGTHLTLNYEMKTAFRIRRDATFTAGRPVGPEFGTRVFDSRGNGAEPAASPAFGSVRRGPIAAPPPGAPFDEPPMIVGTLEGPATMQAMSDNLETERLAPRIIEGLTAEGTRTTLTIPAGTLGNELPIEVINERWFSPELQIVLMTRRFDPRFGETIYRLTNLSRAEPDADLFKVPAGFRIKDVKP